MLSRLLRLPFSPSRAFIRPKLFHHHISWYHSLTSLSHSSRNSVKRESEDESMATGPTGPSDEPTDLSVGGGREREERDRERQERERYYR